MWSLCTWFQLSHVASLHIGRMVRIGREHINVHHIVQSALHVVQVGLAYLLMLIAMTYNGYLFLAVCIGAGIGYYIFGACRKQMLSTQSIEDRNDHCT